MTLTITFQIFVAENAIDAPATLKMRTWVTSEPQRDLNCARTWKSGTDDHVFRRIKE